MSQETTNDLVRQTLNAHNILISRIDDKLNMLNNTAPITAGFFKLDPRAIIPTKGTPLSAGWDLYALEDAEITLSTLVRTGVGVKLPQGCYGRIAPRSGLSVKGLCINAGVVDIDYASELKVVCFSVNTKCYQQNGVVPVNPVFIKAGDRIAQLVLEKISYVDMPEISLDNVVDTQHTGFGSTGV
jgi:dUTP pyrophosphatase